MLYRLAHQWCRRKTAQSIVDVRAFSRTVLTNPVASATRTLAAMKMASGVVLIVEALLRGQTTLAARHDAARCDYKNKRLH